MEQLRRLFFNVARTHGVQGVGEYGPRVLTKLESFQEAEYEIKEHKGEYRLSISLN